MTLTSRQFLGQAARSVAALSLAKSSPHWSAGEASLTNRCPPRALTGTLTIMNRWSNPGEPARIKALFKQFEHMYPGVTVRNRSLPGSGRPASLLSPSLATVVTCDIINGCLRAPPRFE
jgi:ABC-type glycerol-3-phosphate transport system substrate-binding protein